MEEDLNVLHVEVAGGEGKATLIDVGYRNSHHVISTRRGAPKKFCFLNE
jgi:hypothetical protein